MFLDRNQSIDSNSQKSGNQNFYTGQNNSIGLPLQINQTTDSSRENPYQVTAVRQQHQLEVSSTKSAPKFDQKDQERTNEKRLNRNHNLIMMLMAMNRDDNHHLNHPHRFDSNGMLQLQRQILKQYRQQKQQQQYEKLMEQLFDGSSISESNLLQQYSQMFPTLIPIPVQNRSWTDQNRSESRTRNRSDPVTLLNSFRKKLLRNWNLDNLANVAKIIANSFPNNQDDNDLATSSSSSIKNIHKSMRTIFDLNQNYFQNENDDGDGNENDLDHVDNRYTSFDKYLNDPPSLSRRSTSSSLTSFQTTQTINRRSVRRPIAAPPPPPLPPRLIQRNSLQNIPIDQIEMETLEEKGKRQRKSSKIIVNGNNILDSSENEEPTNLTNPSPFGTCIKSDRFRSKNKSPAIELKITDLDERAQPERFAQIRSIRTNETQTNLIPKELSQPQQQQSSPSVVSSAAPAMTRNETKVMNSINDVVVSSSQTSPNESSIKILSQETNPANQNDTNDGSESIKIEIVEDSSLKKMKKKKKSEIGKDGDLNEIGSYRLKISQKPSEEFYDGGEEGEIKRTKKAYLMGGFASFHDDNRPHHYKIIKRGCQFFWLLIVLILVIVGIVSLVFLIINEYDHLVCMLKNLGVDDGQNFDDLGGGSRATLTTTSSLLIEETDLGYL
ncbi:hypothetical protein QR98_0013270 [Sarcoptes scabiei]|uniref:Uncharacterized protein n=1 Tax=Sarcoptes scabiei TaxID=52283 RepID=A0A131ZW69_SARSC|nr:hypothetical protein QR98_0013270 [Sarcoptes scabiei]